MKQFLRLGDGYALTSTYDTEKKRLARGPLGTGFDTASEMHHVSDAVYTPAGPPVSALSAEKSRNCRGEAAEKLAGLSEANQEACSLNGVVGLTPTFSRGLATYQPPISHVSLGFNNLVIPGKRVGDITDISVIYTLCIACRPSPKPNTFATLVAVVLALFMCLTAAQQVSAQQAEPADAVKKQPQAITGTVADTAGQPIQGATVSIIGVSVQTQTDEYGRFSLRSAVGEGMLRVRFVGFQTLEVPVEGPATEPIWIALIPTENLIEEVEVSTGYQTIPKERATGSFVHIDNELLNRRVSTNILERLDGVTSGLYFDKRDPYDTGSKRLQLRGLYTLGEYNQPLIVLDNFAYEGDINDINPEDIASITVLKDAAATSIWGARAANGVIVLNTKKGAFGQPNRITFNVNFMDEGKRDLSTLPWLSAAEYIEFERFLFEQGAYDAEINLGMRAPLTPAVETLLMERTGNITWEEANRRLDNLNSVDFRNDMGKHLYQRQLGQRYSISTAGGSDGYRYYVSVGYDDMKSMLIGNDRKRIAFRMDNSMKISKRINAQFSLGYTNSRNRRNSPGDYTGYKIGNRDVPTYVGLSDEQGQAASIDAKYRGVFTDTVGQGLLLDWKYRPMDELRNNKNLDEAHSLIGNLALKLDLVDGVFADARYQYQRNFNTSRHSYDLNSFFVRDLVNQFTDLDKSDPVERYPVPRGGILDYANSGMYAHSFRTQMNIDRWFFSNQHTNVIVGMEVKQDGTYSEGHRTYGYDERLNYANVDLVNRYPTFSNIAGLQRLPNSRYLTNQLHRFVSYYGNLAHVIYGKYTISASFRRDAANLFGVETNRKGRPLWSIGARWQIDREDFLNENLFPSLALRATFGWGGNVSMQNSPLTIIRYQSPDLLSNLPYATIDGVPSPHLRWEKVGQLNLALDFAFANNRVTGTLEYYKKKGRDLLALADLDITTGLSSLVTNSAHIDGDGFDLQVRADVYKGRSLLWKSTILVNYTNSIVRKYLRKTNTDGFVSSGEYVTPLEGYEPFLMVSYKWGGLSDINGNPLGYLANGELSDDYNILVRNQFEQQLVHGSAIPTSFGNLLNEFSWKKFSLSSNIIFNMGWYFRRKSINYDQFFRMGKQHEDFNRRWTKPGDEQSTFIPSFLYPFPNPNRDHFYANSAVLVEKGDILFLDDIRLAYNFAFNPRLSRRIDGSFYFIASNLNVSLWRSSRHVVNPLFPNGVIPPKVFSVGLKISV